MRKVNAGQHTSKQYSESKGMIEVELQESVVDELGILESELTQRSQVSQDTLETLRKIAGGPGEGDGLDAQQRDYDLSGDPA